MVSGYGIYASCIKAIKSNYSTACKGSKTIRKKGMNEHSVAEKEAGAYEATGCVVETTEERSVRKSHQAVEKHPYPSSSAGGSSQKTA